MGSYAELSIDNHSIISMKSYVDPVVMTFFEECDRQSYLRKWVEQGEEWEEHIFEYAIASQKLKQRLDIMGFNLESVKGYFDEHVNACLKRFDSEDEYIELRWMNIQANKDFFSNYTFDRWVKEVQSFSLLGFCKHEFICKLETLPTYFRLIAGGEAGYNWGFPECDIRLMVRALLEAFADSVVKLDYSSLVSSGYYDGTEKLAKDAKYDITQEFIWSSSIVILTEGSSDAKILRESLKLLYPHLFPSFSFLDFEGPRLSGGASGLVQLLKGFAAANIANRVVAVFDNDTAAEESLKGLDIKSLPPSFKVIQYPNIDLGRSYPTVGPQGDVITNINGLAASIELYLGEDVLRDPSSGELMRVQWKGYNQSLQKYQGELLNKNLLMKRFDQKLLRATTASDYPEGDWSSLKSIWEAIISACITDV
ncbi:hypothetical protein GCM10023213_27590 [Prosthecobacter algae]|uniref:HEPN/Toprim N-terminal domain-containing protein n=1 Tax=Prosthecobacter algae TaxID=1144682 RepID=A0ABP9PB66_9BACT